jgi:hypothetical protein
MQRQGACRGQFELTSLAGVVEVGLSCSAGTSYHGATRCADGVVVRLVG